MDAEPHSYLAEVSLARLAAQLEAGEISSVELARAHLDRVAALDVAGPALRSVIEVNPDALSIARERDDERARGRVRGPLHGIPVMVKDNLDTGDRMLTTAGSLALTGASAAADAPVVARLRAAGAVLLGKTNLSEWANFRSSESTSGWSGRGRLTRNPYLLDRTPSGSSSGSGVAVAAGMCAAAIGTETDGSIVSPAAANSVVGLKPGVGTVSQVGIVPISRSQDAAGPMTRTVADAALVMAVIADRPLDFAASCRPDAMNGRRIGVLREPFTGYHALVDGVFEEALLAMREAGAELVDPVAIPTIEEIRTSDAEQIVMRHEFHAGIDAYLAGRQGIEVRDLGELVAFNRTHSEEEMPYFGQDRLELALETGSLEDPAYLAAAMLSRQLSRERGIDAVLAEHGLAALVAPTGTPPTVVDLALPCRTTCRRGCSQPAAMAGYPIISVPAGFLYGSLPVGISFFASAGSEALLLGLAFAFEAATGCRRPPRFHPGLVLG
jgi:amidase